MLHVNSSIWYKDIAKAMFDVFAMVLYIAM